MINAFVVPDVTRLPLPGGHWVDVKVELTYGEEIDMYARMRRQFGPNETPILDTTQIGLARMGAYIVGWSLTDPNGKPIPVGASAFVNLKTRFARALRDALAKHETAVDAAQDAEKNDPDGATVADPISPSAN